MYDAIIVGGSFAGLAVASRLRGRVLLISKEEIGEGQTSACGTLLAVPLRLGLAASILHTQRALVFHTPTRTARFEVSEHPFCTFDYRRFCRDLAARLDVEVLRAHARGVDGDAVVTDRGTFRGRCLIDASGWRAVLAGSLDPDHVRRGEMSYGIETVAPRDGDTLCFWYDPTQVPRGVQWFFPVAGGSRIGVAAYDGDAHLRAHLEIFLGDMGLAKGPVHGGYFPAGLREATVRNVFVVGDAAGHCLPFTGEGIRPALYFGQACGSIVQEVIEGRVSLPQGLQRYRAFVGRHAGFFRFLGLMQRGLLAVPTGMAERLIALTCGEPFRRRILGGYVAFADPGALVPPARSSGQPVPFAASSLDRRAA